MEALPSPGAKEIKSKCAALLDAVGEVPQTVESFLQRLEADLADQKVGIGMAGG